MSRKRRGISRREPHEADVSRSAWRQALWAAIVCAVAGTYWSSLSGPFVFDDGFAIIGNASIRQWWRVRDVLSAPYGSPVSGRPIVNLSLAINYAFGGVDVLGYHLWNVALHGLCALLVFACVRRTFTLPSLRTSWGQSSVALGFATAMVWALHPLNSEVVNYVTQRTESMMALCFLLTMYASIRAFEAREIAPTHESKWKGIAVLSCALGMGCKESMVVAPLVVVLYDRTVLFTSWKDTFAARRGFYGALASCWIVLAGLNWSWAGELRGQAAGLTAGTADVSPWTYLLNQAVLIPHYLRLAVWPRGLVSYYGRPQPLSLGDVAPFAALMVALLAATVILLIKKPMLGFLAAWFFITLAPSSSVVPIATEVGAERRMYLPLMAIVLVAVLGVLRARSRLPIRRSGTMGAVVLVVVSMALAGATVARTHEYESEMTLARANVNRWPTTGAHDVLGAELMVAGQVEEGMKELRAAVPGAPRARLDLAGGLFAEAKYDDAIEQLNAFIAIWEFPPAQHPSWQAPVRGDVVTARTLLGRALVAKQRWPEATAQFRLGLSMDPSRSDLHGRLGGTLVAQGEFEEAADHYRTYLKDRPRDEVAHRMFGRALAGQGRLAEARVEFEQALQLAPDFDDARSDLRQLDQLGNH